MAEDNEFKGRVNTMLQTLSTSMQRIENKLDEYAKWQQGVMESLAAGNEKFRQLEDNCKDNRSEIRKLKDRDRNLGVMSVLGNIIAGIIGTVK